MPLMYIIGMRSRKDKFRLRGTKSRGTSNGNRPLVPRGVRRNPAQSSSAARPFAGSVSLRSQIATSNVGRGGRRYLPYAFTEHGAFMAASVLNSPRAIEVSVFVVRAIVKLRRLVLAHKDLAGKLDQLERKVGNHDEAIKQLVAAIRQLMAPPDPPKKEMGFHTIRDSAKEQTEPSKPTASAKAPKRRKRNGA